MLISELRESDTDECVGAKNNVHLRSEFVTELGAESSEEAAIGQQRRRGESTEALDGHGARLHRR